MAVSESPVPGLAAPDKMLSASLLSLGLAAQNKLIFFKNT